jgi:hypothetical protein
MVSDDAYAGAVMNRSTVALPSHLPLHLGLYLFQHPHLHLRIHGNPDHQTKKHILRQRLRKGLPGEATGSPTRKPRLISARTTRQ